MGFRFFRRIRIAPGITFNLSKRGASISTGPRGAKYTVGTSGTRRTIGLPGTGFYYTEHTSSKRRGVSKSRARLPESPGGHPQDGLSLGFFRRLVTPKGEQHLVDGLAALVQGNEQQALHEFEQATHLPDAAFFAGVLHLKKGQPKRAAAALQLAAKHKGRLGRYLKKYGAQATMQMSVTPQVMVEIRPDRRGLLLALVEALQEMDQVDEAIGHLKELRRISPDDPAVTLSLVELLIEGRPDDRRMNKKVLELTDAVENKTELHAAILLFRAKALAALGLHTVARTLLSTTLRRKKNRSDELLRALRYERAIAYQRLSQPVHARKDLELIYADDPDHEDVAQRLGID